MSNYNCKNEISFRRKGALLCSQGSLTVETALVLPLTIIFLAVILYMGNVLYTENLIHSKMMIASDKVALSACVLDKTTLLDDMQKKYREGDEVIGEGYDAYLTLSGKNLKAREVLIKLGNFVNDSYKGVIGISRASNYKEVLTVVSGLISSFGELRKSFKDGFLESLPDIRLLFDFNKNLANAGEALGINIVSQFISQKSIEYEFYKMISKEDLEKMRVSGLKIENGAFLIPDDTISFSYSYSIFFPFVSDLLGDGYKVSRSITTRGFTGSYDAREVKAKKKGKSDKYVYIATTSVGNSCYHYISCLRKPVHSISKREIGSREVCARCRKKALLSDTAYCVSGKSKIHYDRYCSTIYSRYVKRLTLEEAKKLGYRPCSKKGCVGDANNK